MCFSSVEQVLCNPSLLGDILALVVERTKRTSKALSLLNVSRQFRHPIVVKRVYQSLRLNDRKSKRVLCLLNGDEQKVIFRDVLCIDVDYETFEWNYESVRASILLRGVKSMQFNAVTEGDLSVLGHVKELDLNHTGVADASPLRKVQKLNLSSTKVIDVSALGNVRELDLSSTKVSDVSALGNVRKLNLSWTKVTDVSALGNVLELDLSWTGVTDVSALSNVHSLCLAFTSVTDVSALVSVHTLNLNNAWEVHDVSALINVRNLNISMTKVADISALENLETLYVGVPMRRMKRLRLKPLKRLKTLFVENRLVKDFRQYDGYMIDDICPSLYIL